MIDQIAHSTLWYALGVAIGVHVAIRGNIRPEQIRLVAVIVAGLVIAFRIGRTP